MQKATDHAARSDSRSITHQYNSLRRAFATGDVKEIRSQFSYDPSDRSKSGLAILIRMTKRDSVRGTFLHVTAEAGQHEAARTLLEGLRELGAKSGRSPHWINLHLILFVNARMSTGTTALQWARRELEFPDNANRTEKYAKMVALLREYGATEAEQ